MTDQLFTKRVITITLTALSVVGLLWLVRLAWTPLVWVGIAAFLAVAVNPIIHWLQRYMPKKSIGLATFVTLGGLCVAGGALAWLFFAPLVQQTTNLIAAIPQLIDKAGQLLADTPFTETVKSNTSQLVSSAQQIGGLVLSLVSWTVEAIVAFVTIVALMFFMTLEGKTIKQTVTRLTPANMRKDVSELGSKVYVIINGYVIGNFLLSALYGITSALMLWALGNPYFLVLGLVAGILDLIPLIGSTIAAILIALVCILSGQMWVAAMFAIFTIVYVQIENAVLNPLVYAKKVDISPLTVLIAVLIGASIAGVVGTLLAIPAAATIKETGKLLTKRYQTTA